MISREDILEIAKNALKKFNIKVEVKFVPYRRFIAIAKKSPIISQALREGNTFEELSIPALMYHKNKNHIYLSEKILKKLLEDETISLQKRFIQALAYHEAFHIMNNGEVSNLNFQAALQQETAVTNKFKKEYPALESIGRRISKKYINF